MSRYESAHSKVWLPMVVDKGDWLHNTFRFVMNVVKNTGHIIHKAYSKIFNTKANNQKVANIIENVNNLSDEDFQTLLEGLQSYEGHTNLVSPSLRKAVLMRAKKEETERRTLLDAQIEGRLQEIRENHARSKEIEETLQNQDLSEEEREILLEEKRGLDEIDAQNVRIVQLMRSEGAKNQGGSGIHGLEEENKSALEGSNIRGRKLGRRVSKNLELEKKQSDLKRQEREAQANGDNYGEVDAFLKHEDLLEKHTFTKKKLGITVSRGDRNHSEAILEKGYMEDDLLNNVLSVAGISLAARGVVKAFKSIRDVREFNAAQSAVNEANAATAGRVNGEIDNLQNGATSAQMSLKTSEMQTDRLAGVTSSAATHDAGGLSEHYGHYGRNWSGSSVDSNLHAAETAGNLPATDDALKYYSEVMTNNPEPNFSRVTSAKLASDFIQNGGMGTIQAGYDTASQFISQAVKLGKVTFEKAGEIHISPDLLSPAMMAMYAARGSKKVKTRDTKNPEQSEAGQDISETTRQDDDELDR